jgi:hypothetical protein
MLPGVPTSAHILKLIGSEQRGDFLFLFLFLFLLFCFVLETCDVDLYFHSSFSPKIS